MSSRRSRREQSSYPKVGLKAIVRAARRDHRQPLQRPLGELRRAHVVHGHLRGHRRQHEPHEAHVVVVGQPRHGPVAGADREAVLQDPQEVVHQRGLGHHHTRARTGWSPTCTAGTRCRPARAAEVAAPPAARSSKAAGFAERGAAAGPRPPAEVGQVGSGLPSQPRRHSSPACDGAAPRTRGGCRDGATRTAVPGPAPRTGRRRRTGSSPDSCPPAMRRAPRVRGRGRPDAAPARGTACAARCTSAWRDARRDRRRSCSRCNPPRRSRGRPPARQT